MLTEDTKAYGLEETQQESTDGYSHWQSSLSQPRTRAGDLVGYTDTLMLEECLVTSQTCRPVHFYPAKKGSS